MTSTESLHSVTLHRWRVKTVCQYLYELHKYTPPCLMELFPGLGNISDGELHQYHNIVMPDLCLFRNHLAFLALLLFTL